ncbi:hypothetical protein EZV73_13580 [Acidaminobacter sp. JC074]|uniref:hypothetical protein n=1 Tax=Acidaminobacter sp. JC074 TaxID=2530199 RepID=UPI001F0F775F|nr:hypothetical protein [Acidaminobacter sp. JC074]MCH4888618.1 hypothetical protein [Acidaminobacter sp. JC074]
MRNFALVSLLILLGLVILSIVKVPYYSEDVASFVNDLENGHESIRETKVMSRMGYLKFYVYLEDKSQIDEHIYSDIYMFGERPVASLDIIGQGCHSETYYYSDYYKRMDKLVTYYTYLLTSWMV